MSKLNPIYQHGDLTDYRNLHVSKMRKLGKQPVCMSSFRQRLERGVPLKEAIDTPADEYYRNMNVFCFKRQKKTLREKFIGIFR